ncbi:afg2, partial [Symbiodinium microadriaticum]
METILLPRRFASIYSAYGVLPPTAVLLHGPPGTGKTWIAGAVAREISGHFISMKLSDILSGHVGVAESRVREVFSEAKLHSPCIVFIDEFQALFAARHDSTRGDNGNGASLTSTLSGCLDDIATWNASAGLDAMVTVIAATNEPWAIDVGFLRPGRFDKVLYVGPMNKSERTQLIVAQIQKLRGVLEVDCDASVIADRTAGFT